MRLKLSHVTKGFKTVRGTVPAVADISLEIADREFFVLLGPSGCGKSTLLNLIAGLEKPTGGEIWFDEQLVASAARRLFTPPKQRNVAMVFQSYALYPHLTVRENIAFPLRLSGEKPDRLDKAVNHAAATLGITGLLAAKPGELSGGQRQRVAIARAVVRRPNLFLLDEPLSNLDAQLRAATRLELKKLQSDLGITTVYVTHDQVEAMSLGDRVALLRGGRLEQLGPPAQLYDQPANAFVARFIGSPPMNLLRATLEKRDGVPAAVVEGQALALSENQQTALQRFGGSECLIGIRPEQLEVFSAQQTSAVSLTAVLSSVESLGREILLHTRLGRQPLTVLTSRREFTGLPAGTPLQLRYDGQNVRVFGTDGQQETLC